MRSGATLIRVKTTRIAGLFVLFVGGCQRDASPLAPRSAEASAPAASAAMVALDAGAGAAASAPVVITVLGLGRFEVAAPAKATVRTVARLERRGADGAWSPPADAELDLGKGYRLLERCDDPAPACIDVTTPLQPVAWTGLDCSAQCNHSCRANRWVGPGTFRLVVLSCDGATSTAGPAFEVPGTDFSDEPAFARWGLATHLLRGSVARLELPDGKWDAKAHGTGVIAGFTVRPATEHALAPADVEEIAKLLQNPHGYDDQVLKRCQMEATVGFRLTRQLPTTGAPREEILDLGIDLHCSKFFAARGEGPNRYVHSTHFDPSHASFVALVKRLFPDDAQLRKLR